MVSELLMASTANAKIGSEIFVSSSHNTFDPRDSSQNFNTPSSMVVENSNPSCPYFLPPAEVTLVS